MNDPQHEETFADTERKLRDIITTLRAQLAEAQAGELAWAETAKMHLKAEQAFLSWLRDAGEHLRDEGVTICDDGTDSGEVLAAKVAECVGLLKARADRAEAALAEQKRFKDRIIAEASDALDAIGGRCDAAHAERDGLAVDLGFYTEDRDFHKARIEELLKEREEVERRRVKWMNKSDAAEAKLTKAVEALREIADEASVTVRTWKNGINFKKMYEGWRAIAVARIDIARKTLAELEAKE